jgi:LysM repeat protein
MRILFLLFISSFLFTSLTAQISSKRITKDEYIATYKEAAVKEMKVSGVPASITLAQAMLESDYGNSYLAVNANNHFGIKCHSDWTGPKVHKDDDTKNECFRKYKNVIESYHDHSEFLKNKQRYAALFLLDKTDYKAWAYGLKEAGYATNPKYPELLIKLIEDNNLNKYDSIDEKELKNEKANEVKVEIHESKSLQESLGVRVHPNNIKYIIAKEDDTPQSIAKRVGMWPSQIAKYNDLKESSGLQPGMKVYIQPKRNQAKQATYTTKPGDRMWGVSQEFGIKLKKLHAYNKIEYGKEPMPNTELKLRKTP